MNLSNILKHLAAFILIALVLLAAGWIRSRSVHKIPEGQFTSTDAYRYAREVEIIAKFGQLPKRDMHRWYPLGRDTEQSLNVYPYVLAYTYKLIKLFFPNVTHYQVQLLVPVICFVLGMGVLCLFLYHYFGLHVAVIVGILLAIMPGCVERSTAGFSDRDSWCWLLGVLAVVPYLWKEQTEVKRNRFIGAAVSGFFMFLGGLSWEGFGVFGLVILAIELWRFLTTEKEVRFTEYLLWILLFVPWLYLFSPAYRRGEGFTTYLTLLVLLPPLVLLALRALRYFLINHKSIAPFTHKYLSARTVALLLCAGCFILGMSYAFSQQSSFTQNTVPFSNNRLMQTVTELEDSADDYWYFRYGGVFLLGSLGIIGGCARVWGKKGIVLAITLCLITFSTFFRVSFSYLLLPVIRLFTDGVENVVPLSRHLSFTVCEYLFNIALPLTCITALGIACTREKPIKNELIYIAMAAWFLLWVGLARNAKRYDFFVGISFAFFAAIAIYSIANFISEKIKTREIFRSALKLGITVALLSALLFFEYPGSPESDFLAKRGILTPTKLRGAIPGQNSPLGNALKWMKTELPESENAVVAVNWSYGSILNVLGNVKTITDQDHYIQHWIHLYSRHVFCAQSEVEALEFLKTHKVTHWMLIESDILNSYKTSFVGSNDNLDRRFNLEIMGKRTLIDNLSKFKMEPVKKSASIKSIDIDFAKPVTITAELKTGKEVSLPYVAVSEEKEVERNLCTEHANGGILHYFDEYAQREIVYYLPPVGWNSLAIKLFLRGEKSDAFVPVYPTNGKPTDMVKVWKIRYPSNIKENLKYLATEPKNKRSR
ncbi:MAG: hypothetical protein OXU23_24485 [Candidatus Poribacteria bacterium]|nr:hypothetical protein [Candidatus Poribacteria bacterium]